MLKRCIPSISRGTGLGFFAGVLPGAGASLGSFLAYSLEKQTVDREGNGSIAAAQYHPRSSVIYQKP